MQNKKFNKPYFVIVYGFILVLLTSCDLSPDKHGHHYPRFIYPSGWKGKGIMDDAHPSLDIPRGRWWEVFNDPLLNKFEMHLQEFNPNLQAAAEAFTQSRDIAKESESQLYPQIVSNSHLSDNKASLGRLFFNHSSHAYEYESNELYSGAAHWEPDFWHSIRNTTRMQKIMAQASAADYALIRLSLQAELASDYIALRGIDAQLAVYNDSIRYFGAAVKITKMRQNGAIGAGLDVSRSENQLYSARAEMRRLQASREMMEHAISVLLNMTPMSFHIEPWKECILPLQLVNIKAQLPSTLLERRPDIVRGEHEMEASLKAIGVARAAFYPHIFLSATGGFQDGGFDLAKLSNSFWQIAVNAIEPIFTGGLRRAALQRAWAQYRENVDQYRAVILNAFQEVEDSLSQTKFYHMEQLEQHKAVHAAMRTQKMTMSLYTGGLSNYLDALIAQQQALKARLLEVNAQTEQLRATVKLIRALGGGWDQQYLPTIKEIDPFSVVEYNTRKVNKVKDILMPPQEENDPKMNNLQDMDWLKKNN